LITPARLFLILGGINAALAVALGAFGAHGLKARLTPDMLAVYQTGVHYHLFHALGLLAVGLSAAQITDAAVLRWSGWLMLAGIVLFCGSLYVMGVAGLRWLGAVTPLGGLSFIVAWGLFVVAMARSG
jgi:uncharacterized membrane protein YgdD (TMEM256/DUF423 family)